MVETLRIIAIKLILRYLWIVIASEALKYNKISLIKMKYGEFGKMVSAARKAQGVTQLELQDLCGVSASVIYKIEAGRDDLSLRNLISVMDALGVKVLIRSPLGVEVQLNG